MKKKTKKNQTKKQDSAAELVEKLYFTAATGAESKVLIHRQPELLWVSV